MNKYFKRTYLTIEETPINIAVLLDREPHGRELSSAILYRFSNNWVVYMDGDFDPEEFPYPESLQKKCEIWTNKFNYIYDTTKDKYNTLMDVYQATQGALLDKLKSTTVSRFNDTPQNGGLYDDDQHTTNITQSSTEIENEPLVDRLSKVQNMYRDLLRDWVDEFVGLFGEEI